MTHDEERRERRAWREQQERLVTDRDFAAQWIAPLAPDLAYGSPQSYWRVELVRSKASDRMTFRYNFGEFSSLYGKTYFHSSCAYATYRSLTYLWSHGFDAGCGLEIPEPLSIVEEAALVVTRNADGVPLDEVIATDSLDKAICAARAAARWLAKFHSTEIPDLEIEPPVARIEILKLADVLAKAAAEYPSYTSLLIGMLHQLESVAPSRIVSSPFTPVHGQFRPAHVFIKGGRATVIDIEKICLSDPAKDVARFVHVLNKTCLEQSGDRKRAGLIAQEFVSEYRALAPSNLRNLDYFLGLLAFKAMAKVLKNRKAAEDARQAATEMHRIAFEQATRAPALPLPAQMSESSLAL